MWQLQTYNYTLRKWQAFGKPSADFHALYQKAMELHLNGHRSRVWKLPEGAKKA